jgi:iron complex outermembrane receptor protein
MAYWTIRHGLMLGASALALGLSAPAIAQDAPAPADDTTKPAEDEEPAIVVTGLRASIASAQSIKQNSGQFVDSITAIDIGKLPDANVAEALQRISGIQIFRNRGEGSSIAIRGLTQVRTEVNGRDSFGASGGRSLGFEDVPSELLGGVDVYKNPSAELIEGGIGGLVNLRTRMPFDQKGLLVSGTVGMNYYDLIDDTKPNASLLVSDRWETGIGEIGVLVDLSYFQGAFRSDDITIEPYFDRTNVPGYVGKTLSVPDGAGIGITFGQRKRKGAYAAVQWAPSSNLEIYGQFFRTDYFIETPNYTSFVTCGTDVSCANNMALNGTFKFDNDGKFISGSFGGFGATANNSQFTSNRSVTADYSTGFKWAIGDNLKLNGDFQYIDSLAENRSFTAFPQQDGGSLSIDLSGDLPKIAFGPGTSNPANYYIIALMDHLEDSKADEKSGRLDLEWSFDDDSPLKSFTAGVRYTDRSAINRSTPYNWQFLSAPWGGSATAPNGLRLNGYEIQNPFDSSFFYGKGTGVVGNVPFLEWHRLRDGATAFSQLSQAAGASCCGPFPRTLIQYAPTDINTQSEQTMAAYGMLRFDFDKGGNFPLDGNIGLRVVRTKNEASGFYNLTYRVGQFNSGTNNTVNTPYGGSQNYTEFLPSLNLRYHLTDDLQLRAAASRGLSRPNFYDLRANFTVSQSPSYNASRTAPGNVSCGTFTAQNAPNECFDVTYNGNGGNPLLKPLTTNQADVALEWFPSSSSMLYGTLFYKKVNNFAGTAIRPQSFAVPGYGTQTFQVTSILNGDKGTIKGFEVGGNTFFSFLPAPFDGFGVQANATYVDSKAPSLISFDANGRPLQTPLQGLSKWSYNLVGFYEKHGLTARVAYNWRDDYLDTVTGNGTGAVPIYRKAYGQLDASLSYDFSKNFSATLDVVNLLRQRKESYQAIPEHPRDFLQEDRRIGVSLRLRN